MCFIIILTLSNLNAERAYSFSTYQFSGLAHPRSSSMIIRIKSLKKGIRLLCIAFEINNLSASPDFKDLVLRWRTSTGADFVG